MSVAPCVCPVCRRPPETKVDKLFGLITLGYVVKCDRALEDSGSFTFHTVMMVDYDNIESAIVRWNAMYAKKEAQA